MCEEKANDSGSNVPCHLSLDAGRLHVRLDGQEESVAASIVYLRPLSSRSEVAFFDDDSREILSLSSIDELSPACRSIAEAQLASRYHMPRIQRVTSIETIFGTHYWKVETNRGMREFAFKEPGKNVTQLPDNQLILRDTMGNRYEIHSLTAMDPHSRRQVDKIL